MLKGYVRIDEHGIFSACGLDTGDWDGIERTDMDQSHTVEVVLAHSELLC